jgi:hypothetical protein
MAEANALAYRNSRETNGITNPFKDVLISLRQPKELWRIPKENVTKFVHVQTDGLDKEKL